MSQARVMITEECNFSCSYCCNKLPEIRKSWANVSYYEFMHTHAPKFNTFALTGGEPLLKYQLVRKMASQLKELRHDVKVFLYTNAALLTPAMAMELKGTVDGIDVGLHSGSTALADMLGATIHPTIPVRLFVQDNWKASHALKCLANTYEMELRLWRDGECENVDDQRFKLDHKNMEIIGGSQ